MQSLNFEILRKRWPELSELGANAEEYAYSDPQSALLKLRCFAERIVNYIYRDLNLSYDNNWDFFDKLKGKEFNKIISRPILDKFHGIRIKANHAIHKNKISDAKNVVWLIKEAYCIACWFYTSYKEGTIDSCKEFISPINKGDKFNKLKETIKQLEDTLEQEKQKQTLSNNINQNNDQIDNFTDVNNSIAKTMNVNSDEIFKRISMDDIFIDYQLTTDQTKLIKQLEAFLEDNSQNVFLLRGYAGTGKTFIAKGLTEYFTSIGREFILAAPTGKAAKIIKEKIKNEAFTIHKTIYSYKDLKEYKVEEVDGTETFKFYFELNNNIHSSNTIYIIDEASMIADVKQEGEFFRFGSGKLLSDLMEFINLDHNDHNKKIIFIGDNAQLPPIGMNFSPALDAIYLTNEFNVSAQSYELTNIIRQNESSEIVENSFLLRESIRDNIFNKLDFKVNGNDILHTEYSDLLDQYLKSCHNKINAESIIIAHSNKKVDEYNILIRKHFFPEQKFITAGDKVMSITNNGNTPISIYNGDFGLIKKVDPNIEKREVFIKEIIKDKDNKNITITTRIPLWFRKVEIGFKNIEDGKSYFFECMIFENILYRDIVYNNSSFDNNINKYGFNDRDINRLEMIALYVDFTNRARGKGLKPNTSEFKQEIKSDKYFNCLKVKFGYALTCHKAQGSEWNNVFVDCNTHMSVLNQNYFRWLYTAITRASKKLYTLDEPHITLLDNMENTNIPIEHIQDTFSNTKPVQNSTSIENPFNIEDKFLLAIYQKIASIIESNDIRILDLHHNQYQEQYTFESNDEQSKVTIYYNARNIITSITPNETNNLSNLLKVILEPFKSHILTVDEHSNFTFTEKFLEEFYLSLKDKFNDTQIKIVNIDHLNYMERYSFNRDEEIAIIDFTYNGRSQFARTTPNKQSNSRQLIQDILGIFNV